MATKFDPNVAASELTVAELKDVLASQNVSVPKVGKRQVYVDLYDELIAKGKKGQASPSQPPPLEDAEDESAAAAFEKDADSLTVNELKSALSAAGVSLPVSASKKQVYVDLFNKHKQSRSTKAKRSPSPTKASGSPQPSTPLGKADSSAFPQKVSPARKRPTSDKKRKAADAASSDAAESQAPARTRLSARPRAPPSQSPATTPDTPSTGDAQPATDAADAAQPAAQQAQQAEEAPAPAPLSKRARLLQTVTTAAALFTAVAGAAYYSDPELKILSSALFGKQHEF